MLFNEAEDSFRVVDWKEQPIERLDEVISDRKEWSIKITYPLSKPFIWTPDTGSVLTLREFCDTLSNMYAHVYNFADVYGVWGHSIGELFLEGYEETSPGLFHPIVGS